MQSILMVFGTIVVVGGMLVIANLILHWLSGATNTKFVSKYGGKAIIDNTAKNRPNFIKINKDQAQLRIEEELLEIRKKLRASQNKIINDFQMKNDPENIKKQFDENELKYKDYHDRRKRYEIDLKSKQENLKNLVEHMKNDTGFTEDERFELENQIDKLNRHLSIEFDELEPLKPILLMPIMAQGRLNELYIKHEQERSLLRLQHSKIMEFDNELDRIKFIEQDRETEVQRTKLVDTNKKMKT